MENKLYSFIRPIITAFTKRFLNPKFIGLENIPNDVPIILAGNHTHNFDCLLLISSTKRQIHFLAKKELFSGPQGLIFRNLGLIPVDRKNKSPASIISAQKYLEVGKVVGIFPEATFHKPEGTLLPFKIGAVKIAFTTNTKIVPFHIKGQYKLFSRNLQITFGPPLTITSDNLEQENQKLKDTSISLGKET